MNHKTDKAQTTTFDNWIRELDEQVIQGEYGYERGEFDVFPENWRQLFDRAMTPQEAFRHALNVMER